MFGEHEIEVCDEIDNNEDAEVDEDGLISLRDVSPDEADHIMYICLSNTKPPTTL